MARTLLLALLLCLPLSAAADPISLVATLAPVFGSAAAGFIVSYGGYIAFGALQLLGAANARRKQRAAAARARAEYNANLQDRNVTVLTNEANWRVVYGSPAPIGGVIVDMLTSGNVDQFQHLVVLFASHESEAIDEVYLEGDAVGPLDADGWATAGGAFYEAQSDVTVTELVSFVGGVGTISRAPVSVMSVVSGSPGPESSDYVVHGFTSSGSTVTISSGATTTASVTYNYASAVSRVRISKHLSPGGVDTADAYLMAALPGQWTADHRISGHTYIVLTLDLRMARFQGGPPNVSVKMRGKKVYDYRTSTTAYSANAALCAADFIASEYGYGATTGQVDTATAQAAANDCDAQGFECHGMIDTGAGRDANLQQIENAFAGASHYSGGVWRIMAGAWSTPVMTLTDAMMAAPIEVVQASEPAEKRYTGARGKYAPASGLGVADDFTPYDPPGYDTADGQARVHDMELPMTATNAQCQKLAAIAVEKSRLGLTINCPAHFGAWHLQPGDRVYVTNAELGFAAKPFRLVDWTYISTAPIGLVLTEDAASVYTGTFSTADPTRATSTLADPFARPAAPADLQVFSGTDELIKGSDGTIITRARITWAASTVRAVLQGGYTQIRWRDSSTTDDAWISADLPADATSHVLENVPDAINIIVQVRHITGVAALGNWATAAHTVVGKTEPPPDVSTFAINDDRLSWTYPTGVLDLDGFEVRFNYGSNDWWDSATPLHSGIITDNPYTMTRRPVGPVTLLIKAVDTSGNYSVSALAIVTELGDQTTDNILLSWPQAPTFAAGVIEGGTLVGAELQADALDEFFAPALESMFTPGSSDFFPAGLYGDMTYTWFVTPTSAGTLLLEHDIDAGQYSIECLRASQDAMFTPAADLAFEPAADYLFGPPGVWAVWPGSLSVSAAELVGFRITALGGGVQGRIIAATVRLDVPDIVEQFSDLVIAAAGTRLPIAEVYRAIAIVQITTQADGNGGITARAEDKDPALGPLIQVFDAGGIAVDGLIDATIQGY